MRILERQEADSTLEALGVRKDTTECYMLAPEGSREAILAIDDFEPEAKGSLLTILLAELLKARPIWWLVPKYRYFGEQPWSREQWAMSSLPPLKDEVLECSIDDLPAIDKILMVTCEHGGM
jgi:hypothetical protein